MAAASLLHVVGYAIQATSPPFPIFCLAATLIGFGASIQDAQANSLVASVHHHSSEKMGLLHAIYGNTSFFQSLLHLKSLNKLYLRFRVPRISFGIYAVCANASMVVPLFSFLWSRPHQHNVTNTHSGKPDFRMSVSVRHGLFKH